MPMRLGRAQKYVRLGKAKFMVHSKLGIRYLELLVEPSSFDKQPIRLGFDDGSVFDGISVVSKFVHHENMELIHNKNIKDRMDTRRKNRRRRRRRLRNRPCRLDFRTSEKMVPTIRSMLDFRMDFVNKLLEIVPISHMFIERNSFNFFKKNYGGYATQAMQGVDAFIDFVKSKSIECTEKKGFETKKQRVEIFGIDKKIKRKNAKSFFAHCVDSYALATMPLANGIDLTQNGLNTKTRFISKIHYIRRQLHQEQRLPSTKYKQNQHLYKKYGKGGIVEHLDPHYGKKRIIRVQKYPKSFRVFETIDLGRDKKYHKNKRAYGGTVYCGISKWSVYKHVDTGERLFPVSAKICRKISKNIRNYRLIGFKKWHIEIVKESRVRIASHKPK